MKIKKNGILKDFSNLFTQLIKDRGEDYYNNGHVYNLQKTGDNYYAKVEGSHGNFYSVSIEISDEENFIHCDCPYEDACKHMYAVLLAIEDHKYSEGILKEVIQEQKSSLEDLIKSIPAKEIKDFVLKNENIILNKYLFEQNFRKYLPKQTYKYYYNNLFNEIVLEVDPYQLTNEYFDIIGEYIKISDFDEVIKILKAIINAFCDTEEMEKYFNLNWFAIIGMNLRIAYRKGNSSIQKEIIKWKKEIEKKDFYNNYYLEDIFLSIK